MSKFVFAIVLASSGIVFGCSGATDSGANDKSQAAVTLDDDNECGDGAETGPAAQPDTRSGSVGTLAAAAKDAPYARKVCQPKAGGACAVLLNLNDPKDPAYNPAEFARQQEVCRKQREAWEADRGSRNGDDATGEGDAPPPPPPVARPSR